MRCGARPSLQDVFYNIQLTPDVRVLPRWWAPRVRVSKQSRQTVELPQSLRFVPPLLQSKRVLQALMMSLILPFWHLTSVALVHVKFHPRLA